MYQSALAHASLDFAGHDLAKRKAFAFGLLQGLRRPLFV
jgi:hypothetical protein